MKAVVKMMLALAAVCLLAAAPTMGARTLLGAQRWIMHPTSYRRGPCLRPVVPCVKTRVRAPAQSLGRRCALPMQPPRALCHVHYIVCSLRSHARAAETAGPYQQCGGTGAPLVWPPTSCLSCADEALTQTHDAALAVEADSCAERHQAGPARTRPSLPIPYALTALYCVL